MEDDLFVRKYKAGRDSNLKFPWYGQERHKPLSRHHGKSFQPFQIPSFLLLLVAPVIAYLSQLAYRQAMRYFHLLQDVPQRVQNVVELHALVVYIMPMLASMPA